MKNKTVLLKSITISVVYFVICFASILFCRMVPILEGVDLIGVDVGGPFNDILPYNFSLYNFQEFSPWAAIPLTSPFILSLIVTSGLQNRRTKELLVLVLLIITLVAYNESINATWSFLQAHCYENSLRGRYTMGILYPTAYTLLSVFTIILEAYLPAERGV